MLRFTSLTVEDFGPFKGSQTIDFTNENGVIITWGNNGRGKTKLLNAFRYALYGKFQNRRGANVELTKLSNIESHEDGRYGFKVVLRMTDGANNYELTRQYKLRAGVTKPVRNDDYEQHVYLKREGAILPAAEADHILRLIMPEQVSRFFLFDGELLQEYEDLIMEDSDEGVAIKGSIENILGIPVLTNGAVATGMAHEDCLRAMTRVAKSNQQTEQIGAMIEAFEAQLQKHVDEFERMKNELTDELVKRAQLTGEAEQNEHVRTLLTNMNGLEQAIEEKKARRDGIMSQIVVTTKNAWKGLVGSRVTSVLDGVKARAQELEDKEKAQQIASGFVKDMKKAVSEKHCHLCEQDIEEGLLAKIEERIKKAKSSYGGLSAEEAAELKELQGRRSVLEGMQLPSVKERLEVLEQQLTAVRVEIGNSERELKSVREELERHGDIKDLSAVAAENLRQLTICLTKIGNLEEGKKKESDQITSIRTAIAGQYAKLEKLATDSDMLLAKKKADLCGQITSIFEEGISKYRDELKAKVEKDATDLFVRITNDPDYVKLLINENYGLEIVHSTGVVVPLRSSGNEHMVALALIGALHKNAPLHGPVIMDSPFGRLDPVHKHNITEALPVLSDQVILFAYTSEIDEQFARDTLGPALKKEYRLTRVTSFNTRIEPETGGASA
ncbi:AAA family ATPase [Candidatus Formimonas warabiya]|uniref:Nuclease SbcCD subunit C n=1 Tax=Formimonas warabiya TaxID=1761012 RepID=A0A3G1KWD1_FORW1|nr:AAA family ATPase [Candidatus Formimonas warabiya]ATW26730.1 hypothetical protein DCMF_19940 [Candidatus Formimonas warabiya]